MRQPEDNLTLDLLKNTKPTQGRPPKHDALSGAERARRFRAARKAAGLTAQGEPLGMVDRAELVAMKEKFDRERLARIDADTRAKAAESKLSARAKAAEKSTMMKSLMDVLKERDQLRKEVEILRTKLETMKAAPGLRC
jgi:hypothetical protein